MFKKSLFILFLIVLALAPSAITTYAQDDEREQQAIDLAAQTEELAGWLAEHDGWIGYAYESEDASNVFYVEFYTAAEDDWLGYANVDLNSGAVMDAFAPRPLPADEYATGQERATKIVLADPEVQLRLLDPVLWDYYVDFNRYERVWEVYFYRGTEALKVKLTLEDYSGYNFIEITDQNALNEEETLNNMRNEAISLAYSAEGIDSALEGYGAWFTYVEQQAGPLWSVAFVSDERELFFALVDIVANQVIQSYTGE